MLSTLVVLLPCMMCLVWDILASARKNKGHRDFLFIFLMILFTFYFYTTATFLQNGRDYGILAISEPLSRILVPAIFPMAFIFMRSVSSEERTPARCMAFFIPAIMIATIFILLWVAIGTDGLASFISYRDGALLKGVQADYQSVLLSVYEKICYTGFLWLVMASALALICYGIISLSKNGFNLICLLVMLLAASSACDFLFAKKVLAGHRFFAIVFFIIQGVMLFFLGWLELFRREVKISWKKLFVSNKTVVQETETDNVGTNEGKSDILESDTLYSKLLSSFNEMMDKDRCYLNPGITVESIAQQLGTNRVYISRVINRTYNMTFPEYVNGRRLETAKQMLLEDPNVVLEYVALKSGFSGLSQFSRKFKEMTGMSPRAWQASQNVVK